MVKRSFSLSDLLDVLDHMLADDAELARVVPDPIVLVFRHRDEESHFSYPHSQMMCINEPGGVDSTAFDLFVDLPGHRLVLATVLPSDSASARLDVEDHGVTAGAGPLRIEIDDDHVLPGATDVGVPAGSSL